MAAGYAPRARRYGAAAADRGRDGGGRPETGGATAPGLGRLIPRERELVTLIAQSRTDTQIAARAARHGWLVRLA